jgi:hypothetical protein
MVQPINYMQMMPQTNIPAAIEGFGEALQARRQRIAAEEAKAAYATDLQTVLQNPSMTAFNEFALKYPSQREAIKDVASRFSQEQKDQEFNIGAQVAVSLENQNPDVALDIVERTIQARKNAGLPTTTYDQLSQILSNTEDPDRVKRAQAITNFSLTLLDPEKFGKVTTAVANKAKEAREAELHPTLVSQRQQELSKAKSQAEIEAINAKYAEKMARANLAKAQREATAEGGDEVQSSKILDDGTTVIVTKTGRTRVVGTDGNEIMGDARTKAIRDAQEFGIDIQTRRAGGRKGAEIGQVAAQKAFESVGKVRQNIENLNSAVSALDRGARTGAIEGRFPNWRASSIELQNIQRQLGLDIIGSVTFGALSEGELNLALETALPTTMNERELKSWLQRKITAQTKLADYLSQQARFLSVPGRTLNDWLEQVEKKAAPTGGAAPSSVRSQADAIIRGQ